MIIIRKQAKGKSFDVIQQQKNYNNNEKTCNFCCVCNLCNEMRNEDCDDEKERERERIQLEVKLQIKNKKKKKLLGVVI